jgi:Ca2+-binding RTX toxin-like protein
MATGGITNDAQGDTFNGIEQITGSNFGDIINGDNNANTFFGMSGDDWLFGQGGNDTLKGGLGDDQLRGGAGNDILVGGQGSDRLTGDDAGQFFADTFVIVKGPGVDTVVDFQAGLDKIQLAGFGSTPLGWDGRLAQGGGYVGETFYISGVIDGADRFVYNQSTGKLFEVALQWDSDEGAWWISQSTEVANFGAGTVLQASDFIIA